MSNAKFDVIGVGNAIVDVLAKTDDGFLKEQAMAKGGMTLIDEAQANSLYSLMQGGVEQSGGSVANSMAGIASLGGRGAYIGKVGNDSLGEAFAKGMRDGGTHFETKPLVQGPATARCLIFVTPDAQRTMNTYLGASVELTPDDIQDDLVQDSQITYLEGYLFDPPLAKQAFIKAAQVAHAAGREVSLSLSDTFCVDRHRAEFLELVEHHVDVLFANEQEIVSLYQTQSFDDAVAKVRGKCRLAALTRSEAGSLLVTPDETVSVEAEPVAEVLDTTGAGDLYAAGLLFGRTRGKSLAECGKLGAIAAAEVISHFGARPEQSLSQLIA